MCQECEAETVAAWQLPLNQRPIPPASGEGAIYSPEYLARKEGNARGAYPPGWHPLDVPDSG